MKWYLPPELLCNTCFIAPSLAALKTPFFFFFPPRENNTISVWNNGKGIPVVEHKVEKVYVPALIFGQLLTSSNYDDNEKKVTGREDSNMR